MNVSLAFADEGHAPPSPSITLKVGLPRKWLEGPVVKVKQLFCEQYRAKHPDFPLVPEEVHLVTPGGRAIADTELVAVAISAGDKLQVERGPAPVPGAVAAKKKEDDDGGGHVATRDAIEKTVAKSQFAFDHSKWDRLDLSDDDGDDCHPNIELASWKRIKAQQRRERREKEEAELASMREELAELEAAAGKLKAQSQDTSKSAEERAELAKQHSAALTKAQKCADKLQKFLNTRKIVAEDVCSTTENRSAINPAAVEPSPAASKANPVGPIKPDADFEGYDAYVERNEANLRAFAAIERDAAKSEAFLTEHPELLCQHADGFLLLLCLDTAMRHEDEAARIAAKGGVVSEKTRKRNRQELVRVVRQHLLVNYVLELAKVSNQPDPRAVLKQFFFKTARQTKEQTIEMEKELEAFTTRIEKRALDKLAAGEKSPLDRHKKQQEEPEYEPADVGPGGLDPNEVLPTLPKEMQEAFVEQDVGKLKSILAAMPQEEASYHLDRCIASGLWVVPHHPNKETEPDADLEDDEDEDERAGNGKSVAVGPKQQQQ